MKRNKLSSQINVVKASLYTSEIVSVMCHHIDFLPSRRNKYIFRRILVNFGGEILQPYF